MKFENKDGVSIVTLENNDILMIKKPEISDALTITMDGDEINISGGSNIIGSIKGAGMLEKVYIPPVVSSQDIITKCDEWLEMFKKIHDKFKELVLSDKYREQSITMQLSFSMLARTIRLDLKRYITTIQDGVFIGLDEENEDVYAYLVANVLDYYVSKNYKGTKVNNWDIHFNGTLYSNESEVHNCAVPIIASLCSLMEDDYLASVVHSILSVHDLGVSSKQIIDNLRGKIVNQTIGDKIDNGIDYTTRQYEYIINETEAKAPLRKRSKKDTNNSF